MQEQIILITININKNEFNVLGNIINFPLVLAIKYSAPAAPCSLSTWAVQQ